MNFMAGILPPEDISAISKVPILNSVREDAISWRYDKKGNYTVRSAYHICLNNLMNSDHLTDEGEWKTLWKLQVPPHVKTFLWQLSRECLPVRTKIHERGVPCPRF